MIGSVVLTADQLNAVEAAALKALPRECCGLIVGRRTAEGGVVVSRIVESANRTDADPTSTFEIDPAVHIHWQRTLRDTDEELIGVYHSHPSSPPVPSDRDARDVTIDGWVWLITAVDGDGQCRTGAYVAHLRPQASGTFTPATLVLTDA